MAGADNLHPITIVHTDHGMCLTTMQYADWREVQDVFSGYKASVGAWDLQVVLEYLPVEYPGQQPFPDESVRRLAKSVDGVLWAQQLSEEERQEVPVNVRAIAAAAGEILDRLDHLYDQRSDALAQLLAAIESHMPMIGGSVLGRLAAASRSRLLDLDSSRLSEEVLNRQALAATDELRLLCASTWAEDSGHAAVEHKRIDELMRLLDAGWDVDDATSDGMTLVHHAIDVEVDGATQAGSPLGVELTTLLVNRGADLGHRWQEKTPLEAAKDRGHYLAVDVIRSAIGDVPPGHRGALPKQSRWAFWKRPAVEERDV